MVDSYSKNTSQSPLLYHATLSSGITIDPNRDCDRMAQALLDRYPEAYKTFEEVEEEVRWAPQLKWEEFKTHRTLQPM